MRAALFARVGFASLLLVSAVSAQGPLITVDNDGYGDFGGTPLPFLIGPDPTIPTFPPTLIYLLPARVVPGDVIFLEPGDSAPTPCDLLRFVNVGGQGTLLFYAEPPDAGEPTDLADVGLPGNEQSNFIRFAVSRTAQDGFLYAPGPNDPGYFLLPGAAEPTSYNFIGIVPEPAMAATVVLALLACLRRGRSWDSAPN